MRGVFLDRDTIDTGDLDWGTLESALSDWRQYGNSAPDEVATRIADAELVVTNKVALGGELLAAAPQLRLICAAATGTNHIDVAAATRRGITVCNVRAYATASVVQHVFMLMIALAGRFTDYREAVAGGRWQRSPHFCLLDYPIREIARKTLGIVGYGELGRAVARVAEAFGMEVLVAQRPGGPSREGRIPLDELLGRIDVLSLHCPLTPETRGLIGRRELALMKSDTLLINTARGGIVDEPALAAALRAGMLGGAGVDVLSVEPPSAGNALLDPDIPNLIVTPHIAWASRESRQRLVDEIARNIRAFAAGEARNVVESQG
jgi:glycerate dehydrogenase